MITNLFFLAAIWFILAFFMTMLVGTRWRHSDFFTSLIYHLFLVGVGDLIALWMLRVPGPSANAGALVSAGELAVVSEIAFASAIVLSFSIPFILLLHDWNAVGQAFLLCAIFAVAIYLIYAFAVTAFSPLSPIAFVFSFLLFLLEVAALSLSLTYAFEVLDVLCRVRWHRRVRPKTLGAYAPMVSLHVPAYNEPPELVEQTLRALAALDYPFYEVILVDNNTPDESTWQPLAKVCQEFGFKCLHLEHWPGYKSGALNFALAMTDPKAELIGVIDADYIVQPNYLRRIVPFFEDSQLAFVQAPQDYRNANANRFFQAAFDGYKYFFALSMPARNERNAIIFCGTMGLLRKKVLEEIGGWDEWCITEDAEASLRILNRGYQSLYIDETFGRGLMPLNFEGLKKQRFRWAFGGVQILKKHWGKLMPWARWIDPQNRLTGAQRYFYLMSGLQWFNELLTFAFTIVVLSSAFLTLTGQTALLRPATYAFIILPLVLIGTNLLRAGWGLRHALGISWGRAFNALTLWFSLTWVVALACVQAVVRQRGVFLRTPKAITQAPWARALQATSWEATLGVLCLVGGLSVIVRTPSVLSAGLLFLCMSQATIYLSAPTHSLQSLASVGRSRMDPDRGLIEGSYASESRLGVQLGLAAAIVLVGALVASLWPAPSKPPWYANLNPNPIIVPENLPEQQSPAVLVPATATPGVTPARAPTPPPQPAANPSASPSPSRSGTPASSPAPSPSPSSTNSAHPPSPTTATQTAAPPPSPTPAQTPSPLPSATAQASATRCPTSSPTTATGSSTPTATPSC